MLIKDRDYVTRTDATRQTKAALKAFPGTKFTVASTVGTSMCDGPMTGPPSRKFNTRF
jgi:hypothetical protein